MESLVTVDQETVTQRAAEALRVFPQVAGAYLFGSALEKCRPDSDIDIAIVMEEVNLTERERMSWEDEIAAHFTPLEGHCFDIVLLDPSKSVFGYQVLREGLLIYSRNHERVTDVLEMVSRRAADVYPRYRAALEEILAEVVMADGMSYIKEQMNGIRQLLAEKEDQHILNDPWLIKGLKYSLQTSVEAVIDIAYHIAAKVYNHAPVDARDAIRVLTEGGLVSQKDAPTYNSMIGFRNRVVHGYQEVGPERVLEIAQNELSDFERFVRQVSKVLEKVDS